MDETKTDEQLRRLYRDNHASLDLHGFKSELAERLPRPRTRRASKTVRLVSLAAVTVVALIALGFGVNALMERMGQDAGTLVIIDDPPSLGGSSNGPETTSSGTAPSNQVAGEFVSVLHPYHNEFLDAPNYLTPETVTLAQGLSLPDFPQSIPARRITTETLPATGLDFVPKPAAGGHYLWFSSIEDLSPSDVTLGSQGVAAAAARDFLGGHALWDERYAEPRVSAGSSQSGPDGTEVTSWLVRFEREEAAPGLERYVSVRVGDNNQVTQVSLAIPQLEPLEGKLVRLRPVAEVVADLEAWREGGSSALQNDIGGAVDVEVKGVSLAYEDPHSGDEPVAVPVYRFEVKVQSVDGGASTAGLWTVVAAADVVRTSAETGSGTTTTYMVAPSIGAHSAATSTTAETVQGPRLRWGEVAALEGRTITVGEPMEDPQATGSRPGWKVVYSMITITNTGSDPITYRAEEFFLEGNSSGSTGIGDPNATSGGQPVLQQGTLAPGESVRAAVLFNLKAEDVPVKMRLGTSTSTAVTLASWQ